MFGVLPLINLINTVLSLYVWVLIASVVLSWLVAFNVVNTRSPVVYRIGEIIHRLTEPVLRPIRNVLPSLGGIDLSPMVLILLIWFIQQLLVDFAYRFA
ncbi:MAG TPA: YggT family protein [Alphaproteobacteria bacterium]|nr:YggT family protein [Alphaproteobacteria bacterium]